MKIKIFNLYIILILHLNLSNCFKDVDDAVMYYIYNNYHEIIIKATFGTEVSPEYLAALISLESSPPGNWDSERFEPAIYNRLLNLKKHGIPFSNISREKVIHLSDYEIRMLSTSYGLTQIMGYHCLDLGCSIDDLRSSDHLLWSIAYIRKHYLKYVKEKKWDVCFRMHNTGNPFGTPHNKDYIKKGMIRIEYYQKWMRLKGSLIKNLYQE